MAGLFFADTGANQAGRSGIKMAHCPWCLGNEKMIRYHDEKWGVPVHDDRKPFEFLMMEVMQCGLNWNMMIQKQEIFRNCFDDFDFDKVVAYNDENIERIMETEGMKTQLGEIDSGCPGTGTEALSRRSSGSTTGTQTG